MANTPRDDARDSNASKSNSPEIKMPIRQWPIPMDEAVEIVISHMDQETKDIVANSGTNAWMHYHFDIGMWIRNAFGLWKVFPELGADSAWIPIFKAVRDKLRSDKGMPEEKTFPPKGLSGQISDKNNPQGGQS